jgi:hypothetical protein
MTVIQDRATRLPARWHDRHGARLSADEDAVVGLQNTAMQNDVNSPVALNARISLGPVLVAAVVTPVRHAGLAPTGPRTTGSGWSALRPNDLDPGGAPDYTADNF